MLYISVTGDLVDRMQLHTTKNIKYIPKNLKGPTFYECKKTKK